MRRKPYTDIGIRRMACYRCQRPAVHQWQVCGDRNIYRPICLKCDIQLNKLVLRWMGDPNWKSKIERYEHESESPLSQSQNH